MWWLLDIRWWGVCALIAVIAVVAGNVRGRIVQKHNDNVASIQRQNEELKRDLRIAKDTAQEASANEAATRENAKTLQEKIDEFARRVETPEPPAPPAPAAPPPVVGAPPVVVAVPVPTPRPPECRLDSRDIAGLRGIATSARPRRPAARAN